MAKTKQQTTQALRTKRQKKELSHLHFAMTSKNYVIIGIGIVIIVVGYLLMSENSVSGFLPTVIAPVLLIFGYCVVVPAGILFNDKGVNDKPVEEVKEVREEKTELKTKQAPASSNIKTN